MAKIFFAVFIILATSLAFAVDIPQPTGVVNDYAGIFSAVEKSSMEAVIIELEKNTSAEIAVLIVTNMSGLDINSYANMVFDSWKIGKECKTGQSAEQCNNGLLVLFAQEEKRIWVQTGYGLEGTLPDSKIGRLLDTYYVPERDNGNVSNGVYLTVIALADEIRNNYTAGSAGVGLFSVAEQFLPYVYLIFIVFAMTMSPIIHFFSRPKCPKCGSRMSEHIIEYGRDSTGSFVEVEQKCRKCGYETIKKKKRSRAMFVPIFVGGGGGGFGGGFGGFGGGGSGGGGAGR